MHESVDKDSSQPFPCQNRPCGCKAATQCWTSCCCFSAAEKLAWAERNGVTPPIYARLPSSDQIVAEGPPEISGIDLEIFPASSNCCDSHGSCCESKANAPKPKLQLVESCHDDCKSETQKTADVCCESANGKPSQLNGERPAQKRKIIVSVCALKCMGKGSTFTLLPWYILPKARLAMSFQQESGVVHPALMTEALAVFYQPETPPPKSLSSI